VAGATHEFDDAFDDDERAPLLPPEDRLWRHPSEVHTVPVEAQARAARDRWLSSTPTRAGAWSAGFVGAMLATGVVLVGTHVTNWLGQPTPSRAVTDSAVTTTIAPELASSVISPQAEKNICSRVHLSLAAVKVTSSGRTAKGDGVVLASNGKILVPLSLVAGVTSSSAIDVTTQGGVVFSGWVLGSDQATDLAVIGIGSSTLTPLAAAPDAEVAPGQWLAVEWSMLPYADSVLSMGAASSLAAAASKPGNFELLDNLRLQALDLNNSPLGTVLLNAKGQLLGMIVRRDGDQVVEMPGNLAERVGDQIVKHGHVTHGWLGIKGQSTHGAGSTKPPAVVHPTVPKADVPTGVEVTAVNPGSSAAAAGLRAGDVIEAVNGEVVASMQALQADLYTMPPRAAVRLTIDRGTSIRTIDARLQAAA
jgi:S1-C subfamily serine protease